MNHAGTGAGPVASAGACDVFVSYAHADRPKAAALAKALQHRGLKVWWDPDLRAGDPWARKIEEAVETALSVVVLWSAEAVESRWVSAEARVGLDHDRLVPVRLDDAEPPLVFREIQWHSVAGWDGEGEPPGIEKLVEDVEAAIARSRGGAAGTKAGEPTAGPWPWPAIGALVVGVALGVAAVALDLWGAALEAATDAVVWSGFPLPPLAMQAAAAGLSILYLARHWRRVWPLRAASLLRVLTYGLALALGLGVPYDWAQQSLAYDREAKQLVKRDHVSGLVKAAERHGMRVHVVDSLGREMSVGDFVDDDDANFTVRFTPVFGDRPRALVVRQKGCAEERLPITRREWWWRRELDETFTCRAEP
jgi:hypothetical protein